MKKLMIVAVIFLVVVVLSAVLAVILKTDTTRIMVGFALAFSISARVAQGWEL